MMPAEHEPRRSTLLAYALPALPLAVLTLPLYVIVPEYYSVVLGLPLAGIGAALLGVRIIDALSDPIAGYLADRTRARLGRRRIWVALALIPTAFACWQLFVPPAGASLTHLFLWGSLLSLASTAVLVPYAAWGAELSQSYAGRTRVAAFRESLVVLGTLCALVIAGVMREGGNSGPALLAIALLVAILLPLLGLVAVLKVPEPADRSTTRVNFREGLRHIAANRPFMRLITAYFFNGLANGLPATLFLFYVGRKLEAEALQGPLLIGYFLCGVLGVPLWLRLAARFGKHRTWCFAMTLACLAFLPAVFLGPGQLPLFAIVCVLTGLALGADLILPASQQADVIDVDTARSGEQRSGLYLALWGLSTKLALALAVGIAFPLLERAGFRADGGESGLAVLGFLYAGLPVILKLVAIRLMWNFPLGESELARTRAGITARASERNAI
jgi:Na+/melibiose symporter-like transporter